MLAVRKNGPTLMGFLLFLVPLLPALYLPALGENPFCERYLYLPSAGLLIVVVLLIHRINGHNLMRISYGLAAVTLVLYSMGTLERAPVFRNDYNLWSDVVKKTPESAVAHKYLASALYSMNRLTEAINEDKIALQIDPTDAETEENLGVAYASQGDMNAAVWHYQMALYFKPDFYEGHANLGQTYIALGLLDQAFKACTTSARIFPGYGSAHNCLGIIYGMQGKLDKAVAKFQTAANLEPEDSSYQTNLQRLYN
jgi:tetratricopeptide (TPR) repeat protein